jgi:hypothetical protein
MSIDPARAVDGAGTVGSASAVTAPASNRIPAKQEAQAIRAPLASLRSTDRSRVSQQGGPEDASYGLLASPGMDDSLLRRLLGNHPVASFSEVALADQIQVLCVQLQAVQATNTGEHASAVISAGAASPADKTDIVIPPELAAAAAKVLQRLKSQYDLLATNRMALLPG